MQRQEALKEGKRYAQVLKKALEEGGGKEFLSKRITRREGS